MLNIKHSHSDTKGGQYIESRNILRNEQGMGNQVKSANSEDLPKVTGAQPPEEVIKIINL